ncbi:Cdc48-dependent protein degradation adaptor protein-like protein [Macrophomina phaseolina]|uniref:Cdc48-dependent protein degradation adaptor protein-like protein n=1 Tax=Macrophomina phaseolina TaxID=35725 RepID=A0ABQ8FQH9_9PEZI|nr:Cdc48-dependent protein degradation adaptor protein-like protein [Macrophomina phaseolina]
MHFASQDEPQQEDSSAPAQAPPGYTGPRTLSGAPAPAAAQPGSSRSSSGGRGPQRGGARGGLRTLRDIQNEGASQGHAHSHDDDDEEEDQDFFAGGEKSGLAVQNPNSGPSARDQINSILDRARRNAPRPGGDDEPPARQSFFRGQGQTLGGDEEPSRVVPDPSAGASAPRRLERVRRVMHLWRDGFSIDDGRLYRYDDPANAGLLEMINSGRAPLDILDVEHNQEVDLEVQPHKDENYVAPKPRYKPFSGQGQRLGSPTPAATSGSSTPTPAAAASQAPAVQVDDSQPVLNMQIRLGDGTRLQSRFNTTHTVGDLYDFVNRASTSSLERDYALMTTFPSKELNDKAQVLGDMAEFKRGGVVVQKWK